MFSKTVLFNYDCCNDPIQLTQITRNEINTWILIMGKSLIALDSEQSVTK